MLGRKGNKRIMVKKIKNKNKSDQDLKNKGHVTI